VAADRATHGGQPRQHLHDYLQVVDQTPVELDKLCKDILISVTAFFRDTDAFVRLDKVVADILASKQPGDDIRVWVAGCATGEEAYSLAILFSERLGAAFDQYRLQIFATDIDLDAMALARRGVFAASSLAHMDRGRIRANFTPHGDRYEINKNLRDVVIFARQDLVQDPPFLRLDLVSCRNVLIYFQSELQARLLSVFHYALNPGAYLFLGKSEGIFQQEALFGVVDKDGRLYRRHGVSARCRCCARRCRSRLRVSTSISGQASRPPRWVSRTSCSRPQDAISSRPAS
jgi:two-component system CheB/CheR fusion protein